jgi:hypothetical protein
VISAISSNRAGQAAASGSQSMTGGLGGEVVGRDLRGGRAGQHAADAGGIGGADGGDDHGRGQPRLGVGAGVGDEPGQLRLELVDRLPGPGPQRGRVEHRAPEARVAVPEPADRVLLPRQAKGQPAHRAQRRLAGRAVCHGGGQQLLGLRAAVEEDVLLAREVVEDRHLGHPRRLGDLGDRDVVEPALDEHHGGHVGDAPPGALATWFGTA